MSNDSAPGDINPRPIDYLAGLLRGAVGPVPVFGPLLAEVITVTIPEQRIDRIVKFSEQLELRLTTVEKHLLESNLKNDEFTDLLEEGIRQAARSLSDERRSYIATLVANGLTSDDIDHSESKHLLRILDEINDIEVVWLRYYREPYIGGDEAFRTAHSETLKHAIATFGSAQEELNKAALQKNYKEHLCQLGLLEKRYNIDSNTKLPEFDSFSGAMKESGYGLTGLGKLLLHEIGLGKEDGVQ